MLDDPSLERVTRNPKQVRSFDDASAAAERFLTKFTLGVRKIQGFEKYGHEKTVSDIALHVKKKMRDGLRKVRREKLRENC